MPAGGPRAARRARPRDPHAARHRRGDHRPAPRRRARALRRHVRPGGRDRDHDRLDEQDLLGRPAHRLGPRQPGADRPPRRRPRRARHRQPGPRAARWPSSCSRTPSRSSTASAKPPAPAAPRSPPPCAPASRGRFALPAGGLCLWAELDAPRSHRPRRDRRPLRPAPRRRPALRRRRRLRALPAPALLPPGARPRGRRRPARARLARRHRGPHAATPSRPRHSSRDLSHRTWYTI